MNNFDRFVCQLMVRKMDINHSEVWYSGQVSTTVSSSLAIKLGDKHYLLTNAHCVENSRTIEVIGRNIDRRYNAKCLDSSPYVDLALLDIEEANELWKDLQVCTLSTKAKTGDKVYVAGFPKGGSNPSITKGIISRLVPIWYNDIIHNLGMQIDAAINPGNSGGPVFNAEGEVVGMAFSHSKDMQNMCYMIPAFLIEHYLRGVSKHGHFPGICDLECNFTPLENESLKKYYNNASGIVITYINPIGNGASLLKEEDVVTEIGDYAIRHDGNIIYDGELVPFWHVLRLTLPGEKVRLRVLRKGQYHELILRTAAYQRPLVPMLDEEINTNYYMFAGLMFMALNHHYIKNLINTGATVRAAKLIRYDIDFPRFVGEEIIILDKIIPSALTNGYHLQSIRLCKINDRVIRNLRDVYKICESCTEEFIKFEFEEKINIILEYRPAKNASPKIAEQLRIPYHATF